MAKYVMKKKNRVITVETDKLRDSYLQDGYDQYSTTGKLVKSATGGKTYTAKQYNDLLEKYNKLVKK
jgi:hypothetical protein